MVINTLAGTLIQGFIYAILALGVYITYSVLDFPDLSVEGTVPLGATVSCVLISFGCNPWLSCIAAFLAGALCGCVTGLLHVKLKIRPLLCGILVMTALLSINLIFMKFGTGGSSIITLYNSPTIIKSYPAKWIPSNLFGFPARTLFITLVVVIVCKIGLDAFLKTKSGLLLRASGNNDHYVTMLACDPGVSKIIGLALGNGFAALAGAVIAQAKVSADLQMGVGMVVIGLASVIIGLSVFSNVRFMGPTLKVILGAIIYKACLSVALELGLNPDYLMLLMAIIFTIALVASDLFGLKKRLGVPKRVKA